MLNDIKQVFWRSEPSETGEFDADGEPEIEEKFFIEGITHTGERWRYGKEFYVKFRVLMFVDQINEHLKSGGSLKPHYWEIQ